MISWSVGRLVGGSRGEQGRGIRKKDVSWRRDGYRGEREGAESLLETDPSEFERK